MPVSAKRAPEAILAKRASEAKGRPHTFLGIDVGASSGRAVLGTLASGALSIAEVHRFSNAAVSLGGTLYWDFLSLWRNTIESIRAAGARSPEGLAGVAIDTWGCDFGLIGGDGRLLANPLCYRDRGTEGMDAEMRRTISDEELYRLTGMSISRIATLPQLLALMRRESASLLEAADTLLFMPDLLRYFLCGARSSEPTLLGTSLLFDVRRRTYCDRLIDAFGIPRRILPAIAPTGTVSGLLVFDVAAEAGVEPFPVMITAGHDTLAAAAAAPIAHRRGVFISSGTWSVVGLILDEPITSPAALKAGFVNEIGFGSVIFVKNLMGFYLLEALRKAWRRDRGGESWEEIARAASGAAPFRVILDMEDPSFFAPDRPEEAVREFLRKTGQEEDLDPSSVARTQYEGLALVYRRTIEQLEGVIGEAVGEITLVGGGSRNELFCQLVADATGRRVGAGPAEATAIGNIGVQAVAAGVLSGPSEIREVVSRSCAPLWYEPRNTKDSDRAYQRYLEIREMPRRRPRERTS